MIENLNSRPLAAPTCEPRGMSTAGRMLRALVASLPDLHSVVFVHRRAGGADPGVTVARVQRALSDSLAGGYAARRWLTGGMDVRLDEVESAPVVVARGRRAPEPSGVIAMRPWARRLVVTNPNAPQGSGVFVLHRQPVDVTVEGRHPVVLLAGRVSQADQARILAIPDVEHCLPRLTSAEDGRIVVDRSAVPAGAIGGAGVCDALTADALDAILAQLCQDPRVATLLHDWVSDAARR